MKYIIEVWKPKINLTVSHLWGNNPWRKSYQIAKKVEVIDDDISFAIDKAFDIVYEKYLTSEEKEKIYKSDLMINKIDTVEEGLER